MILEYHKIVRKKIKLPEHVEFGSESFRLTSDESNKLTVHLGAWETEFTINNPEEFAKSPTEHIFAMISSVYDDVHDYVISQLGDDEGVL